MAEQVESIYVVIYIIAALVGTFWMYMISYTYNGLIVERSGFKTLYHFFVLLLWISAILFCVYRQIEYGIGGTDAIEYKKFFLNAGIPLKSYLTKYPDFEALYMISNWIIYRINPSYTFFLWIYYTIMLIPLASVCKNHIFDRYSFLPLLCLIIFWFGSFNTQRNFIAIFFSLYVFKEIQKKKYSHAFVIALILCGFHLTAVVLFIPILGMLIIDHLNGSRTFIVILYDLFSSAFLLVALNFVSERLGGSRYSVYFNTSENSTAGSFVIGLLFILFVVILDRRTIEKDETLRSLMYIYLFFAPIIVLQFRMPIAYRMTLFSIPLLYLIFAKLLRIHRGVGSLNEWVNLLFINIFLLYRIYQFSTEEILNIIPYINTLF